MQGPFRSELPLITYEKKKGLGEKTNREMYEKAFSKFLCPTRNFPVPISEICDNFMRS